MSQSTVAAAAFSFHPAKLANNLPHLFAAGLQAMKQGHAEVVYKKAAAAAAAADSGKAAAETAADAAAAKQ